MVIKTTFNSVNTNRSDNNTFLGQSSGNMTLTGQFNIGIGSDTLNTLTTGEENVGIGYNVLTAATTAKNNVCLGNITGTAITTGKQNTIVGSDSGSSLDTGDNNIILGFASGSNLTTNESDNIIIANGYTAVNGDNGKIVIGVSGVQTTCTIAGIEGVTPGVAGAKVMIVDTDDQVGSLGAMTDGQLIIGSTGANPVVASLTAGTNITITPGPGTITIDAAGGGSSFTWINSGFGADIASNTGYIFNYGGAVNDLTFTLNGTYTLGDIVKIVCGKPVDSGDGFKKWIIQANASNSISYVDQKTTASGTVTPTTAATGASITMVYTNNISGTRWVITETTGALTIT